MNKEVMIIGFALFAMFFGAGNLIFPPALGVITGQSWLEGGLGFLLTGVGLPLLGVIAFSRANSLDNFARAVSPTFNKIYCTVLTLVIGPLFAIPRTASTTFELGVLPNISKPDSLIPIAITAIIFFIITYFLTIKESKITDIIGQYLTPVILIILLLIGVIGIFSSFGSPIPSKIEGNLFGYGFVNGYQTMDALASILFGVVIIKDLQAKGINNKSTQQSYLQKAGIIAAIGLGLIYFILIYLGSKLSGSDFDSTTGAAVALASITLGDLGRSIFGICVALACLTTSVGVTAFVCDWLEGLLKIKYQTLVLIVCVFSCILAMGGVDFIIKGAVPVLMLLYPVTIVLIILNLFGVKNHLSFKLCTYVVLLISLIEVASTSLNLGFCKQIIAFIPLGDAGFAWVLPFLLSFVVSLIFKPKAA